jgi:hypothetical protein
MTIEFSEVKEAKPSAIAESKAVEAFQAEAFGLAPLPEKHHHGGGGYPYPAPEFHKPESKVSVSPPGHVVPTIELMSYSEPLKTAMTAKPMIKADSMGTDGMYPEQEAAIRHHHNNHFPTQGRFTPPESSISVSPPGKVRH